MAVPGGSRDLTDAAALRIGIEPDTQAPSAARAAIAGFCHVSKVTHASMATLTLLVSELVSNAVLHSDAPPGSHILLCAHLLGNAGVRVEVTDQGSGFVPVPRDPIRTHGGYGLHLVDQQATSWGVDQQGGTRVWFEIPGQG